MGKTWYSTGYPGVRYRKHPTRKHGVKFDQYFAVRYQKDGERIEEGVGWASEKMNGEKAALILAELREASRTGKGETRLSEKRAKADAERDKEKAGRVTFGQFWKDSYLPQATADKTGETMVRERSLYKMWLSPTLAALPFPDISAIHVEKVKSRMARAGQSPRSIEYALALVRQVFNEARRRGTFTGDNPARQVKRPKVSNRRIRFLTPSEAETLLEELKKTDKEAWEMALLSLHCGLRAGEIFKLSRADLNFDAGLIAVEGKGKRSRFAYMTSEVKTMLQEKGAGDPDAPLYPGPKGKLRREVPRTFKEAVDTLEFNEGRADAKDRVVFHTLRHTFASWLAQRGVDSREIQRLLGHETAVMTARYSHLRPDSGRVALDVLEGVLSEAKAEDKEQGADPEAEAEQEAG